MRERRIKLGRAEILTDYGEKHSLGFSGAVRIVRFNRRYYTVYGRCFAVPGKDIPYKDALKARQYCFLDWNTLSNMMPE